ncbi:PD-(D/E)XK nuclease family protein [uncultured Polaribacter sp.]|uniref:PD-(D/E)XK nuclease family protein n=1 Tax=uncultured Polaribacter sp. TaxID=174711 RepID=UPI00261AAE0B|nr:PD-(D/E)XK nuclease family protein [uncultured Polaribacter sp.]
MAFSEKQNLFLDYLLEKVGFQKEDLIFNYKTKLESVYGKYHKEWKRVIYDNGYTYMRYFFRYSNSECIEEVLKEIDIRKNLGSISLLKLNENSKISATDLSSFNFCPVSFSINKSFVIEHPTGEDKRIIGINFHETLRLIDKQIPKEYDESDFIEYDVRENNIIKKIKNCELIFSGHTKEKTVFENQSKNFIGQPDYIFKDPNGKYFVVEEKFKYLNSYYNPEDFQSEEIEKNRQKIKTTFFSNHIIQLASYLDFIKEYDFDYGVLIYWFYDFNDNRPFVHSVSTKIIKKSEYSPLLDKTLSNLNDFIENKEIDFKNKVNPNKCAACIVNKYCAHKTGELNILKIPYNRYDLKLKFVEFPEVLKKPKEDDKPESIN